PYLSAIQYNGANPSLVPLSLNEKQILDFRIEIRDLILSEVKEQEATVVGIAAAAVSVEGSAGEGRGQAESTHGGFDGGEVENQDGYADGMDFEALVADAHAAAEAIVAAGEPGIAGAVLYNSRPDSVMAMSTASLGGIGQR
ncbi:hypothetical protein HDU76_008342, partial [Blyttiomyces sp. JEL0837]